jgi:threonine aldolase
VPMPLAPERGFASDNSSPAHPSVVSALAEASSGHALAYGNDPLTRRAESAICALFDRDATTRFVYGGTGANVFAISALLGRGEAIVSSRWAHIAVDEAGAPERLLGAKIIDLPSDDAKLRPSDLRALEPLFGSQHHATPGVVSLTQPTELGTLYGPAEVAELCRVAHDMGMRVHMDAARLGNAVAALGGTVEALRSFTSVAGVDALSFGTTKVGGMFGEAVVFLDPAYTMRIDNLRKQLGQLHSKMRYVAAQYDALLTDDLWIDLGRRSNGAADALWRQVHHLDALRIPDRPAVNSLFPVLPDAPRRALQDWSFFYDWDPLIGQVRWMASWDSTEEDVSRFADGIRTALDMPN